MLFDRSVHGGPAAASAGAVQVSLPNAGEIAAVKVYGPAPYRLWVVRRGGTSLGLDGIDLTSLDAGWHTFAASEPGATDAVELLLESQGGAGQLAEIELWAAVEPSGARTASPEQASALAGGDALPPSMVASAARPDEVNLAAPDRRCASFTLTLDRRPVLLRRAYLVFQTEGLFRPFSVRRQVNGAADQGGAWLAPGTEPRRVVEEIDPVALRDGENQISFCLPEGAAGGATLSSLRIVGELDRGVDQATAVVIGPDGRDGAALLDGDAGTTVPVAAGEQVVLRFDRRIAPDAVAWSGDGSADQANVECVDEGGRAAALASQPIASDAGSVLAVDGGGRACASLALTFPAAATLAEVDVVGSGAGDRLDWPRIVVSSEREHFGGVAWVGGFTARPATMAGAIRVAVDGAAVESMTGDFGRLVERDGDPEAPWPVTIEATLADGEQRTAQVVLVGDSRDDLAAARADAGTEPDGTAPVPDDPRFGGEGEAVAVRVTPDKAASIRLGSAVGVDLPAGSVRQPVDITVRHLGTDVLPPLDPGLVNVTAPEGHGYEFLPHGMSFRRKVEVLLPFDPKLIPDGKTADDVRAYFYDTRLGRWVPLERAALDVGTYTTRSMTSHFTIMINAVLTVPENKGPLAFDPTTLSSIAAASPAAEIDLVEPPEASSTGDAIVSFALRLPRGRGAYAPDLGLRYSSSAGNSWLGVGWDLAISRVEIDSRFGVPTYTVDEEPRYLLDGAALVPTGETEGPRCLSGAAGRRYRARIETSFNHILRCGTGPARYHFELRDRSGTVFVYGDDAASGTGNQAANASLRSYEPGQGVFAWYLREVIDTDGNITRFRYQVDEDAGSPSREPFRAVYPSSIEYTSHPAGSQAPYRVELVLDDGSRPDQIVSGRAGFKVVTRKLLRRVRVRAQGDVVREYVLTYQHGQFAKSRLASVRVYGTGGCAAGGDAFIRPTCGQTDLFHEHSFAYHEEEAQFAPPVAWMVDGDPDPEAAALTKGLTESKRGTVSFGVKVGPVGIGGSASRESGDRDELVGLYDLNGDGLPDQLLRHDDSLLALYNQFRTDRATTDALLAPVGPGLDGLGELGHEKHGTWSGGLVASLDVGAVSASASGGMSNSTARADRFLTDIDGDGFVDLVRADGTVLLSRPCPAGMCFTEAAYGATASIAAEDDPLLQGYQDEIGERLFLGDPVVQWVAPFTGRVRLDSTARKLRAGGDDGVVVRLYHQDDLLRSASIAATRTTPVALATGLDLEVVAGEAVYLRVLTGADEGIEDDVLNDEVEAHFTATYERACDDGPCFDVTDPFAAREPTGRPVFVFDSRDDFRLAGTPAPFAVPAHGTLELRAVLHKQVTTADLRVCLQRFPAPTSAERPEIDVPCDGAGFSNLTGTLELGADQVTATSLVRSIPVATGQVIVLRVESDLSFDPHHVSLASATTGVPILSYSSVCPPDDDGNVGPCTSDPAVLARVPVLASQFGPTVPLVDRHPHDPRMPYIARASGTLIVFPPSPAGPYLFAIRSDRQGLIRQDDCRVTSCSSSFHVISVTEGESITFELLTVGGSYPDSTILVIEDDIFGEWRFAPLHVRALEPPPPPPTPFAGGHRGFGAALWNEKIDFEPTAILADFEQLDDLEDERLLEIAHSIATPPPAHGGANFTGGEPAWIGSSSLAFVSSSALHAARVGAAVQTGDSPTADYVDVFSGGGYVRLSGTRSYYLGAGVKLFNVAGVSLAVSFSDTNTTTDVVDMNGDGVADVVAVDSAIFGALTASPSGAGHATFDVDGSLRKRKGIEYSIDFNGDAPVRPKTTSGGRTLSMESDKKPDQGTFGLSAGVGLGIGRSQTHEDLLDLNGDGLLDRVVRDGASVSVALNLGNRFGRLEPFGQIDAVLLVDVDGFEEFERTVRSFFGLDSGIDALQHDTSISKHVTGGVNLGVVDFSASSSSTSTRMTREVADLNGDGLPDLLVKKDGESRMRVQFNRGGDFAPPARWEAHTWTVDGQDIDLAGFIDDRLADLGISGPDVLAGTGSVSGKSFSASVNIGGFGFGGGISESTDTYELSLVDLDGDGSVDHVLRRGRDGDPGTVYVKRNQITGKANLLARVSRPLGGSFTLDYEHTDASVDLPGRRPVLTTITVSDGVDLGAGFDSPDQVTEIEYQDGFHHRGEKQFFGFGTVVARRADGVSVTNDYQNRVYALHGRLVRETLRDGGGRMFTERRLTHEVRAVTGEDGAPIAPQADCLARLHPLLLADACTAVFPVVVREETLRGEGGANAKVHIVRDTEHDRFGNVLVSIDAGDDAVDDDNLHLQASYRNDTARWILGLPTALTVRDGSASGALLRVRRGEYDENGNLVAIHVETGSATATTQLAYDAFGNLRRAITPPNARGETQTIDLTYDPVTHSYPIRIRDGFGLESRASYDLRFGVAVEEIDENGRRLARTLDGFGRLVAVRGPYDGGNAAISVEYRHRASPPVAVTVNRPAAPAGYDGPVPPPVTTVTAIDGQARTIEVRKTAVVDGVRGMTTSGTVSRDAVGRAVREYHPFFTAGASDDFVAPETTLATEFSYDALDRAVRTLHPDGAVETVAFAVAPDPDGRSLLLKRSIDANGNARETFTDLAEQVRAFVEHPTPASASIVRYDWTPTNELARVVDAEGNVTRLSYDLRGLRTALRSRDIGLVEERFDLMGNRIALVEPNHMAVGAEVRFVHERDRLVRIDYPSKPDATFSYGAPGAPHDRAGRIAKVVDETGNVETFYGALGEVTRTIREVDPGQPGRTPVRFDTRFVHDSFGRLLEIGYPDGEVVTNSFDAAGELAAVRGAGRGWVRTYADDLRYDVFGNRIQVRYGNGAVSRWTFEPARVRLAALTTTLASAERIQDLRYQYDPAGNPTGIATQLPAPGPGDKLPGGSTLAMTYDGVDRLIRATGTSALAPSKTTSYEQVFAYSPSHNLVHKKRTHIITQPSGIPVAPPHSNIDLAYAYGARPHLATRVGDLEIEYDPSANPVIRRKLDTGMEEHLIWDDDGRLVEFIRGGAHQRNRYDAAGLRVIRRGEHGETIFSSPYFDLENATRGVKHVFAGSTRVATILGSFGTGAGSGGKPPSEGPPAPPNRPGLAFFFHQDHLGSTTVLTDDRGDVHEHLEYFPDGEVWFERGPQRPVNGYLFSGKPFDPETGFSDFGQRFYDPRTSLFLGIDPKVTEDSGSAVGAPMYLAVSAYAAQSPLRFVDPDGRDPCDFLPCEEAEDLTNKATHAVEKVWQGVREEAEHVIDDPWGTAESVAEGTKDTIELSAEGYAMMYILVAGSEQQREHVRKDKRLDRARASVERYIQNTDPDDMLVDLGRAAFWYLLGRGAGIKGKRSSPPPGCFVAGTLVQTLGGPVPIEELRVGDVVVSRDEHTGRLRSDEVTRTFIRDDVPVVEVVVTTETGESEILETTLDHPFWVEGHGWVKVGDLSPGAQLAVNGGRGATVAAATSTTRLATVYNIEVAGAHTYFVGRLGTWVHNKPMRNKNLRGAKPAGMNWSWKSTPTFGHTFNTHGAGKKNTGKLRGRAGGTGVPQGQWLDNAAAAQWLKDQRPHLSGPANVRLPSHVKAQVIMPNGTTVPATWATLVPHPSGGYRSAIPIRP